MYLPTLLQSYNTLRLEQSKCENFVCDLRFSSRIIKLSSFKIKVFDIIIRDGIITEVYFRVTVFKFCDVD